MPSLADTQRGFRNAIAGAPEGALLAMLRCPADQAGRLDIYRRHYRESFRRHLRGRFPTLEWLLGTDRLVALADRTLAQRPPRLPSLAEYGAELVDTILESGEGLPPYAADVASVDWCLGCLSVAVAAEPVPLQSLAALDPQRLADVTLVLQPGLAFLHTDWPVDELIHIRKQANPPEEFAFAARETFLQLQGARGHFSLLRLAPGAFAFRAALAAGQTLGAAAGAGAAAQASFDLTQSLAALFAGGLVIAHSGESSHA